MPSLKPSTGKPKRSNIQVIKDILDCLAKENDRGIANVMFEARVPHTVAKDTLTWLTSKGFVETDVVGKRYKLTQRGFEVRKYVNEVIALLFESRIGTMLNREVV